MVRNNVNVTERNILQSPVCWYSIDVNESIPQLTSSQQDVAMYLVYIARHTYMNAWETVKSQRLQKHNGIAYNICGDAIGLFELPDMYYNDHHMNMNYEWLRVASRQELFSCELYVADIARAINYTGKTVNLIDDIKVAISSIKVRLPIERDWRLLVRKHEILGTQRRRIVGITFGCNAIDCLLRHEYLVINTEQIHMRAFTGFKLWHHVALRSRYSKTLFRLVVQWQKVGKTPPIKFEDNSTTINECKNDIYNAFGIPYTMRTSDIMNRIIEPACKEVGCLLGATITAVPTYDMKIGRKLKSVHFTFKNNVYTDYEEYGTLEASIIDKKLNKNSLIHVATQTASNRREISD